MQTIKELYEELDREYGYLNEVEEIEETEQTIEEVQPIESFIDVVTECMDALIDIAVRKFLATRPRELEDEGEYFYSQSELNMFWKEYLDKGGKKENLHVGKVYSKGIFLCYEVCREKYFKKYPEYFYSGTKVLD